MVSLRRGFWAKLWTVLLFIVIVTMGLTMLMPFVWMVRTSLMDELEVFAYPPKLLPEEVKWRNYPDALTLLPFGRFFLNTAIMAGGMVLLQLIVCSMAAYAFARLRFRGRNTLFTAYISTMLIPQIVTLIPAYLIVQGLGWIDTYWALILPFAHSVWGTFLLRQFFLSFPPELEEAARLDGASELIILFRIILPLAKPALATLAIFAFLSAWQAFLWPLIVTDSMQMRPVEVGIAMFQSLYSRNWPFQMAAAVTVMIPVIVLFAVAQRQFMRGIALSGTQG